MRRTWIAVGLAVTILACATTANNPYAPKPGEWVYVKPDENGLHYFKITCCDCGLVHVFQVEIDENGVLWMRAWRDNDLTRRRRMDPGLACDCGHNIGVGRILEGQYGRYPAIP